MLDVSIETAKAVHSVANLVLILGAVATAAALIIVFWTGAIIERNTNERIAQNQLETSNANLRAAALEKEAEQARLETERLKRRLAWRTLSPDQESLITNGLKGLGIDQISLSVVGNDPEIQQFANQIGAAISKAGIGVGISNAIIGNQMPFTGLRLYGPEPLASKVAKAFSAAGIGGIIFNHDRPHIEIIVGAKPPPKP